MRWLKGFLIFVGLIIFLFGIGLVLIVVYKKEIIAQASAQLKSAIHADVTIGDADITLFSEFPNFTLKLEAVGIKDPSARPGDHDLLNVSTILVNVRTYKLFLKEIEFRSIKIINGEFFVFRSASGYSNLDVFKQQKDTVTTSDSTKRFRLTDEKIRFNNLRFTWHDSLRKKFIGLTLRDVESHVTHFDSLITGDMRGAIDFEELTFNPSRGSFLKDKATNVDLSFNFLTDSAKIRLAPSMLSLHESEFDVTGVFDFGNRNIVLDINSDHLIYDEGLTVIPEPVARSLSKLHVEKPFAIHVHLDAPMGESSQASVEVKFDLKDNTFKSSFVTITDLSLNGVMTNHEDPSKAMNNRNSIVKLDNVIGKVDELPFEAHAVLSDFDDLVLDIFSKHAVTLPQLNREVDTTSIRFTGGNFVSEFHYKGKLNEYFDQETGTYKGDLDGTAKIEKGSFTLISRKLDFKDIGMSMRFNEDTVWIDRLGIAFGKSSANLQGVITNYVPYFSKTVNKGFVKLNITSPDIDMGSFLVKNSGKKRSARQTKQDKQRVSDMLDKLFTMLQFDVDIAVDKLKNRSFAATKVSANVKLNGNTLAMNNVKMNLGGGKLNMSLTMKDLHKEINPIEVKATASNIAVKELFKAFDNFHQKAITDQNLEGLISFDTKFRLKLNDDFNVIPPSFNGDATMIVRNGRLINVEAIHNMSNFLFRKRDFDDVRFAQINGKVKVKHRDIKIARMEIQSSVLTLFLEGNYSLDNDTNLSIQVPLSNLKKRNKDYVPKNIGVDAKVGPSVFLLAKGTPDGKTDISYDGLRLKDKAKEKKKKR
jgi:hypothetical protein